MYNDVLNKSFSSLNTITNIKVRRQDGSACRRKWRFEKYIQNFSFKSQG